MNGGIEHWLSQDAEWILLLTHDVRFDPGSLNELLQAAERNPFFGVLGPVLVEARTGRPFSYGGIDIPENIVGHRVKQPDCADCVAPCAWVDGSIMLLKAQAYRDAGPFESRFFMYFEEPDFCARVRRTGWEVGVALKARAATQPGFTTRPLAFGYLFSRNGLLYARRTQGRHGLRAALGSQLRMSWWLAARPYNRRFYDREFMRSAWPGAIGIWLGLLSAVLRQWGPPPALVRRLSDISGT